MRRDGGICAGSLMSVARLSLHPNIHPGYSRVGHLHHLELIIAKCR